MRRLLSSVLALVCLMFGSAALSACSGKKSTTITSSNGNVTVDQNASGGTTTIKSSEGEVKYGKDAVDPAALGLPVYPGAKQSDANAVSVNASSKAGGGQIVSLSTSDSFERVYDYYRGQMPAGSEKAKISSGGTQMATFQIGDSNSKDEKSVVIQQTGDKVMIQLVHASKE